MTSSYKYSTTLSVNIGGEDLLIGIKKWTTISASGRDPRLCSDAEEAVGAIDFEYDILDAHRNRIPLEVMDLGFLQEEKLKADILSYLAENKPTGYTRDGYEL